MAQILQNWRIMGASLFAAALVVGSFLTVRGFEVPPAAQASGESELLQVVAAKDSDGDGLPDWEESLYGTDPHVVDSLHLGMTDALAVAKGLVVPKAIANISAPATGPITLDENGLPPAPAEGTLTDTFTKSFLSFYIAAKQAKGGEDLTPEEMQNIASQTMQSLSSIVVTAPDYKSLKDLTIAGSGSDALLRFAADAEAVFGKHSAPVQKTEVMYLKDALDSNGVTAIPNIILLSKSYRDTAVGLAVLPVPNELAAGTLELVNALIRKSEIASDLARVNEDPLATILALQQYTQVMQSLSNAFMHLGTAYAQAGISSTANSRGAVFIQLIESFAEGKMKDHL